jgi:hypothetical protein
LGELHPPEDTVALSGKHEMIRARIVERLQDRLSEVEQSVCARVEEVVPDPIDGHWIQSYTASSYASMAAFIGYNLEGIAHGPEWSGPIPPAAVAQARAAASTDVSLGAVLRRYVVGHAELGEWIAREAGRDGLSGDGPVLQELRRIQERLLERLTEAVEREYLQEREWAEHPSDRRRVEIVRRLLVDKRVDPSELAELDYELRASWHLGLIATSAKATSGALKRVEAALGCRLLAVTGGDGAVWAWLGRQREPPPTDIERVLSIDVDADAALAVGSPGKGIEGWRQTHQEAQSALAIALRKPERPVRYADSPLLAAALQDDTLARWLRDLVTPLRKRADGGTGLFEALRAYIDADCNRRAAACSLQVDRHTVESRLRTVEGLLGRTLHTCLSELDVAVRLEELDGLA